MKASQNRVARALGVWGWLWQNVDLLMLAALAVLGLAGWLAAELVDEVLEGETQRYDEWVLRRLRTPGDTHDPIGPAWFEDVWRDLTALGGGPVLALVTAATLGYFVMCRRYRTVVLLVVITLGGLLVTLLLKDLIDRPRPEFASPASYVVTASFPSGHALTPSIIHSTLAAPAASGGSRARARVDATAWGNGRASTRTAPPSSSACASRGSMGTGAASVPAARGPGTICRCLWDWLAPATAPPL
jgi:undecaprenyl-diphosphatase